MPKPDDVADITQESPDLHLTPHIAAGGAPSWQGTGGDMSDPRAAAYDPIFWFHHAGIDWLRRTWQHNNEAYRPWAYGYPVRSGYTATPSGLYDCLGCAAYGLGFDQDHLEQLGRWRGTASAADVLCGGVDQLYTYPDLSFRTRD